MKNYLIACFALLFLNASAASAQSGLEILIRPKPRPENLGASGQEPSQDETAKTLDVCFEPVWEEMAKLGIPETTLQLNMSKDAKVTRVRPLSGFHASLFTIARSAFIDCGNRSGFDLPLDAYERWRVIEITFDTTRR